MTEIDVSSFDNCFARKCCNWQLKTTTLEFGRLPALMGIVNVTPDSFSDGGKFSCCQSAVDHALQLIDDGASIIDIGGESTRPYSDPVTEKNELDRTVDVVQTLSEMTSVPISIDTSKSKVAIECLSAGAEIINDVTGLEADPLMAGVAVETGAGVCAMHMQGTPRTMQDRPQYENVVEDIYDYLLNRRDSLTALGVPVSKICLDPGIGFGKTHQHNIELISKVGRFHNLDRPILVGHSRKGFLAKILGDRDRDRAVATAGVAIQLARSGIQVIRVHDVKTVAESIRSFDAVGGIDGQTMDLKS